ncbi:VOC family protein [Micromonospora sp. DR5-3]|uniref:glyoxalase/bleomycin resistance/dioxygenase family protein n=1 Tax=unclassified Micromonospora TaxID=2617518 RepID=UPI0011DB65DC|nr:MULTISPECIES: glyoxalase/bleomycin resistance/dioxygenase family protein [unclassified Micromonospora]MCW3816856.1 VOC family protein [Micromonospora sp. DR5-3]TYC23753.1 glyoxalase/bleomycin resistance/dioxygenase family protein [Micromonospora sp. MP36]
MANGGNRPIAPVRKLIGAVLGTVATFIVLFGLGMTSWAIVALGVALLVLAIALATVRGGGRTWVVGLGHVHSASEPPTQYSFGRCELQLVIDAPGLPPRSKKIIEPRVPVAKWPSLGQALPVRVALDDQRHVRVLWDEVPTHAETAAAVADLPPEYAGPDPVEEVLIAQEAPPWVDRPDDDFREDLPPASDPLLDDVTGPPEQREPVVVHQRPGGPVVLEGQFVEATTGGSLPRRATPAPRPPAEERFDTVPVDPIDVPLDEPAAEAPPTPEELDEAIFGPTGDEPAELATPISGVGITLLVTDLDRSLDFYQRLGFDELDRGTGNAVLSSGATRLVLRQVTGAAPISRRLVHVNLEVDDIQAAYERLRGSGVRFTYAPRVVNRGTRLEVWAAAFRDPDGHGVALTQWRTLADA